MLCSDAEFEGNEAMLLQLIGVLIGNVVFGKE